MKNRKYYIVGLIAILVALYWFLTTPTKVAANFKIRDAEAAAKYNFTNTPLYHLMHLPAWWFAIPVVILVFLYFKRSLVMPFIKRQNPTPWIICAFFFFTSATTVFQLSQTTIGWYNVVDFGAKADGGTTDNVTAFRATIAAIPSYGGVFYVPAGANYYKCSDSLNFTKPISIYGMGGNTWQYAPSYPSPPAPNAISQIVFTSTTADCIVINSNGVQMQGVGIYNSNTYSGTSTPVTAGHGVIIYTGGQNFKMIDCSIFGFYVNIQIVNGFLWKLDGDFIYGAKVYNMIIQDAALADAGDNVITHCWFYTYLYAVNAHILYTSGGGLKIDGTKFNSGGVDAVWCIDAPINLSTVDFIANGDSFENYTAGAFRCIPISGKSFGDIVFSGDQFNDEGNTLTGNTIQIGDNTGATSLAPTSVNISACQFTYTAPGVVTGGISTGYSIFSIANGTTIGKNQYTSSGSDAGQNISITNYSLANPPDVDRKNSFYHIASASSITFDINKGTNQNVTLTSNTTIHVANFLNDSFVLRVTQDATGGRTLTWSPSYLPIYVGNTTINPAPNSTTVLRGFIDVNLGGYYVVSTDNYTYLGQGTTTQKNATTPTTGQEWYDTTLGALCTYSGSAWVTIGANRAHSIFTPTTGTTVTLVNNQDNIINPSGSLVALTLALPASPANNDRIPITFTQAVTTISYSGGTVVGGLTTIAQGGQYYLTYDSGTTSWY